MRAADLTDALLDYWVARAEGNEAVVSRNGRTFVVEDSVPAYFYSPSTSWALCGPLLEKHRIDLVSGVDPINYQAEILCPAKSEGEVYYWAHMHGETALIAICRAVVRAAFGDEVEDFAEVNA